MRRRNISTTEGTEPVHVIGPDSTDSDVLDALLEGQARTHDLLEGVRDELRIIRTTLDSIEARLDNQPGTD